MDGQTETKIEKKTVVVNSVASCQDWECAWSGRNPGAWGAAGLASKHSKETGHYVVVTTLTDTGYWPEGHKPEGVK